MIEVQHYTLCPFSRKLRAVLHEKHINFELILTRYWENDKNLCSLHFGYETPTLMVPGQPLLRGNTSIFEYLEEVYTSRNLIGHDPLSRAFVREVCEWFDHKFYSEVSQHLLIEKVLKVFNTSVEPNSNLIRIAKKNMAYHLDYIGTLLEEREYLCGESPTLADFAAAAQLSTLDFLGDVDWTRNAKVKHWYSLIKSRPSFKSILSDKLPHFRVPSYYADPDF
ncbi:glutathione S-transferase family protein [Rickettsiales endosymbiont of Peranema trichophorum]|uniref:glutathione S-transferase family protein n=1 Tax=Rickettsiales endosymbiont of Peranema trichophorum TaxID=2486577 RepID=UPI001A917525|nr:glutathione S-transferase family protein [Rickettsiales endosymbiont of Peranema trichophorum]